MMNDQSNIALRRVGSAAALLILLFLVGCSATEPFTTGQAEPVEPVAAAVAGQQATPTPIVVSTPSTESAQGIESESGGAVALFGAPALTYNGEIMADRVVPVIGELAGQIMDLNVDVGDHVNEGDILLRVDSAIYEAQQAQALAGLELAQSQLDLAMTEPKQTDLDATRSAVDAARAAYEQALKGASEEDKRLALSQLKQAEAGVNIAQGMYDRIAGQPFASMMPESLELQMATLGLEAARAGYDKVLKGATADMIAGAYAQLKGAEAQLAMLERGAEPAQIRAAEAGVKQAELGLYLAQLQLGKATIESPTDGFVYQLDATEGAMAGPGALLMILFSDDVKILVKVEESRYQDISEGMPARIRVDAFPGRSFDGVVSAIAPSFDHATRTIEVTIRPAGDGAGDLKPGMFATVELMEQ
ncbi:MAG: efflux RND transporter periplasmic adaptor subunit [Chloroflexota bacterium]|nr:efflux RND transporter periplasmic adaptor subunit [Chloroflexota bacterium]